jgi:hypothetical protein
MLTGYRRATAGEAIVRAFRRAGIVGKWREDLDALVVTIDRDEAKRVRIWALNKRRINLESEE